MINTDIHTVCLSIGSNIENPNSNIKESISLLKKLEIIFNCYLSPLYKSTPVSYYKQPEFINIVLKANTYLNPFQLLFKIHYIENKMNRKRIFLHNPRTIDIDILYYDNYSINSPVLTIPHPRLYYRLFVIKPLLYIDKYYIDPIYNTDIRNLFVNFKNYYNNQNVEYLCDLVV